MSIVFMISEHDGTKYPVTDTTLNKIKNYSNATLHDVLEQRMGYNFVFRYEFEDVFGEAAIGFKTFWQDRSADEMAATVDAIMMEARGNG